MVIQPEIFITPDRPTIRLREPREQVDLDKELPRILSAQGWDVGTYFHIQFVSHDRTTLLASGQFVVTEVREALHTSEANPYQPITKSVFTRAAEQVGDWWTPGLKSLEGQEVKVAAMGEETKTEASQKTAPQPKTQKKKATG